MSYPVIRPIRLDDFDQVFALAQKSGGGMTNLPNDEAALRARINGAVESFAAGATKPGSEVYLMVLERSKAGKREVVGTSAVFSSIGLDSGFVNYRVNWTFHVSEQLNKRIRRRVLVPTHDYTGCGEVGSLFLSPDARGGGFGKLLSRARYLFIAQNADLVADPICAELRGWRGPNGEQPFWDALGRQFFDMEFEDADVHNSANGNQFIADLMPRYPIYACLLPKEARECIGKPHDGAAPAYKMLLGEGFEFNNYVDIFDGGPLVATKKKNIRTIRESKMLTVAAADDLAGDLAEKRLMAAGGIQDFRCIAAPSIVDGDKVVIDGEALAALGVNEGDHIRVSYW